jgi:hypothetical protein
MFENHQYEAHRRTKSPSAPSLPYVNRSDVSATLQKVPELLLDEAGQPFPVA